MKNTKLTSLSIFFPAYNEGANIAATILDAFEYAPKVSEKFEVIVVNDGSTDDTEIIVKSLINQYPNLVLVNHKKNLGYGEAVKTGIKASRYDWIFFTDSDRQFHFDELPAFVKHREKADIVIGRRLKRRDPIIRIILAQIFLKLWNFLLFGIWLRDIDCAYKLFPSRILKNIKLVTGSAITITELMVKTKKAGYTVYQTPVTHYFRKHGVQTGSNPKVILKALRESLKLWQILN